MLMVSDLHVAEDQVSQRPSAALRFSTALTHSGGSSRRQPLAITGEASSSVAAACSIRRAARR